jgi:hypothetical protein
MRYGIVLLEICALHHLSNWASRAEFVEATDEFKDQSFLKVLLFIEGK